MLNERRPDIKPDWQYIYRDETWMWGNCDAKRLGERLIATYAYNKNSVTHLCSITPSYYMVYLGTHAEPSRELTEEEWEKVSNDIDESERENNCTYFDCSDVDHRMESKPIPFEITDADVDRDDFSDDEQGDEDYTRACEDYILEVYHANPW